MDSKMASLVQALLKMAFVAVVVLVAYTEAAPRAVSNFMGSDH